MSDTERVKSDSDRATPSSALAQQAAGRRSRRNLQEVALDSRLFTSIRSKKQPSARVVEPPVQSPLSTRTEWALGRGSCPSRTHRVVRTMLAGGDELHQPGGRLRGRSCSRVRSLRLCVPRPPAHHGPTVLARSVHAYRYRAVGGSVPRGRPPAVPRGSWAAR